MFPIPAATIWLAMVITQITLIYFEKGYNPIPWVALVEICADIWYLTGS